MVEFGSLLAAKNSSRQRKLQHFITINYRNKDPTNQPSKELYNLLHRGVPHEGHCGIGTLYSKEKSGGKRHR
jgi:hypothetical protein